MKRIDERIMKSFIAMWAMVILLNIQAESSLFYLYFGLWVFELASFINLSYKRYRNEQN